MTAFVVINMDNFVKIRAELGRFLLLRLVGKEERKVINSLAYQWNDLHFLKAVIAGRTNAFRLAF